MSLDNYPWPGLKLDIPADVILKPSNYSFWLGQKNRIKSYFGHIFHDLGRLRDSVLNKGVNRPIDPKDFAENMPLKYKWDDKSKVWRPK